MGGGSAPKPDPNIGRAALRTAELGEDYLSWMKDQSELPRQWAQTDRARHQKTFVPLENAFVRDAKRLDMPATHNAAANRARLETRQSGAMASQQANRQMTAMGVNPGAGRFQGVKRSLAMDTELASLGAGNIARNTARSRGDALKLQATNLGKGAQINPLSSFQTATQGVSSGFQGAMRGNSSMAQTLNQQYQSQLRGWAAGQEAQAGLFGALGTAAGLAVVGWPSDEKKKRDKKPAKGFAEAVKRMDVEKWRYKEGVADGGAAPHAGPYAADFKKETGLGDGKTISAADAIGVTMGAVQEVIKKVDKLEKKGAFAKAVAS